MVELKYSKIDHQEGSPASKAHGPLKQVDKETLNKLECPRPGTPTGKENISCASSYSSPCRHGKKSSVH